MLQIPRETEDRGSPNMALTFMEDLTRANHGREFSARGRTITPKGN